MSSPNKPQLKKAPDAHSISNLQDFLEVSVKAMETLKGPMTDQDKAPAFQNEVLDLAFSLLETEGFFIQEPAGYKTVININFSPEETAKISELLSKDLAEYNDENVAAVAEKIWFLVEGKVEGEKRVIVETRKKASLIETEVMTELRKKMH